MPVYACAVDMKHVANTPVRTGVKRETERHSACVRSRGEGGAGSSIALPARVGRPTLSAVGERGGRGGGWASARQDFGSQLVVVACRGREAMKEAYDQESAGDPRCCRGTQASVGGQKAVNLSQIDAEQHYEPVGSPLGSSQKHFQNVSINPCQIGRFSGRLDANLNLATSVVLINQ